MLVEKDPVLFKVDTGAEVTALSDATIQNSVPPNWRSQIRTKPCTPQSEWRDISYKGKSSVQRVFVIKNAKQKHLGCKKVWGQSEATLQTGRHDQKV